MIAQDNRFLFTSVAILSLVLVWVNFSFKSPILGAVIAPLYLLINTVFIGQVFFSDQTKAFRLFYGFSILFSLIVVLGAVTYWFFINFSNLSLLMILLGLITTFSLLNRLSRDKLESRQNHRILTQNAKRNIKSYLGYEDFLVITSIIISFYFLFTVRTGESIIMKDMIPIGFYISYFLACMFTLIKVFRVRKLSAIVLTYLFLLLLIPSSIYSIVLHNPYTTNMMAFNLERARWLDTFGRFTHDPTLPEAISSPIGRVVQMIGWPIGMVALARLFQLSVQSVGLLFNPIMFPMMVVLATFDLIRMVAPKKRGLALFCTASFLVSQHSFFLFIPPGKPETLALGMLLVNIVYWVRYIHHGASHRSYLAASIITLVSIVILHPYVGLFALFIAAISLSLSYIRPFGGDIMRLRTGLASMIVLLLVATAGFLPLHLLMDALTGKRLIVETRFWALDVSRSLDVLFPALWSNSELRFFDYLFYHFINNSTYYIYALTFLGVIAAFKYNLNKYWLSLSSTSIFLAISYRGLSANFLPIQCYRWFYYLTFLSFPLMGIGLYWLFTMIKGRLVLDFRSEQRIISFRPIQVSALIIISSLIFTSSIYAGLPRENSMGPYNWKSPAYPSDYDVSALEFIKNRERGRSDYYIVGDAFSTTASAIILGYRTIGTPDGYIPNISFWSNRELWPWAAYEPFKFLSQGVNYTNSLANRTYLILTYRIPFQDLKPLLDTYSIYFGNPIYDIPGKAYVFHYDKQMLGKVDYQLYVLFDDNQVESKLWELQLIGKGDLNFTIRDNNEVKVRGINSMEIAVNKGTCERATLRHIFTLPQDFSNMRYLLLYFYGSNSNMKFPIVFRGDNPMEDYYFYTVKDEFVGWKLLVIPLGFFEVGGGSPSWSIVNEMLIQFLPGMPHGEWYIDYIGVAMSLPLDLMTEENTKFLH